MHATMAKTNGHWTVDEGRKPYSVHDLAWAAEQFNATPDVDESAAEQAAWDDQFLHGPFPEAGNCYVCKTWSDYLDPVCMMCDSCMMTELERGMR